MAKTNIEIEIRGKLSKDKFSETFALLEKEGKLLDNYKRLSVDLSPGFDSKTRQWKNTSEFDLRVKKSGDSEKISIKVGQFHLKKRQEIEVPIKSGGFLEAVLLLETLGFDKGMVYFWESWEFSYKKYEVKLSKYNDKYYTWEIESKDSKLDPNSLARLLKLTPYTKDEYNSAINWENQNIHKLYTSKLAEKMLTNNF